VSHQEIGAAQRGNRRFGCSHGSEFLTRERAELDKLLVVGGKSKELTNTLVRTTYIRDIKIEREHASESLRFLSVNSDISGFREIVILTRRYDRAEFVSTGTDAQAL
jgi:hypothetical protein